MKEKVEEKEVRRVHVGVAWNARGPRTVPIRRVYLLQPTYRSFHSDCTFDFHALCISLSFLPPVPSQWRFHYLKNESLPRSNARNPTSVYVYTSINLIIDCHLAVNI